MPTYTLTVVKGGAGTGIVTSTPAGIDCGATCVFVFDSDTEISLAIAASPDSTFQGWAGPCSGTGVCNISISEDTTVSASIGRNPFALTVTKSGLGNGTVTSSPAGIDCGATCASLFSFSSMVSLSADPASGFSFAGWSGACSGTGACVVTMSEARNVTATFEDDTVPEVVITDPAGTILDCTPFDFNVSATDNLEVASVRLSIYDAAPPNALRVRETDTTAPYSISSGVLTDGDYILEAVATDTSGNETTVTKSIAYTVDFENCGP